MEVLNKAGNIIRDKIEEKIRSVENEKNNVTETIIQLEIERIMRNWHRKMFIKSIWSRIHTILKKYYSNSHLLIIIGVIIYFFLVGPMMIYAAKSTAAHYHQVKIERNAEKARLEAIEAAEVAKAWNKPVLKDVGGNMWETVGNEGWDNWVEKERWEEQFPKFRENHDLAQVSIKEGSHLISSGWCGCTHEIIPTVKGFVIVK